MTRYAEAVDSFRNAISDKGLTPPTEIYQDGKLHRYHDPVDKKGSQNGWYVFYPDGDLPAGAAGNWKTGEQIKWCGKITKSLTPSEKAAFQQRMQEAKKLKKDKQQQEQEKAKEKAVRLWEKAKPAPTDHPYLHIKSVKPHGILFLGKLLMIPVRNSTTGELQSIQFINPDGSKRFLSGGAISGGYHPIGRPANTLLIA